MPAKRGGGRFDSRPGRAQAHALGGPGPLHPSRISPSYRTAYVHGRPHEAGERCGACRRQGEADEQALADRPGVHGCVLGRGGGAALQLTGQIDSSWWWITAPLWAPICVGVGGFAGLALFERFRPIKS